MTGLHILRAGPLCTVQDEGRSGHLRFGVTPAGPMDWISFATANAMIGNAAPKATVEIGPAGLAFEAKTTTRLAIVAPGFRILRMGNAVPSQVVMILKPGMQVDIQPGKWGSWGYLALCGGVAGTMVMGSMATHLRSGLGGRELVPGDMVRAVGDHVEAPDACLIPPPTANDRPFRCVPGPQDDLFQDGALTTGVFTLSAQSDRMAYRLNGPEVRAKGGHDIVSDGIALGAIQVPGDGQPFVLMADRQPTGGYPKIGTVIRADLPRLAQMRAGQSLRFQAVTVDEAVKALRAATEDVAKVPSRLRHMRFLTVRSDE